MRVAPLQHVIAGAHRKDQRAFLLHHRDALRARARIQTAGVETVQFDAPGKRRDRRRTINLQQRRFAARIRPQDRDQFALARLKRGGLERKHAERSLLARVGVAGLLDVERATGPIRGHGCRSPRRSADLRRTARGNLRGNARHNTRQLRERASCRVTRASAATDK